MVHGRGGFWPEMDACQVIVPDDLGALREAVRMVAEVAGCGDNSCRFERACGAGTSAGCRCLGKSGSVRPGLSAALLRLYRVAKALCEEGGS